jgi:hypothetical protein
MRALATVFTHGQKSFFHVRGAKFPKLLDFRKDP